MKRWLISLLWVFLTFLVIVFQAAWASAAVVEVSWQPNTEPDLAGYKIYYGTSSRSYSKTIVISDKAATTWSDSFDPGTYYFSLTAFDTSGNESGFSQEVKAVVPAPPPEPPGKPGTPFLVR